MIDREDGFHKLIMEKMPPIGQKLPGSSLKSKSAHTEAGAVNSKLIPQHS